MKVGMKASELLARADYCRDLAKRARRMAADLASSPADKSRLSRFIDELEADAARFEREAKAQPTGPTG